MSLSARLFLVYFVFVAIGSYFVLRASLSEIKPAVRQATEESMVDTANILAELLRAPLVAGSFDQPWITEALDNYGKRQLQANIWGVDKTQPNYRIYVTDHTGKVLLDSKKAAVGEDYSHWNDVYLSLQGKYGARSTAQNEQNPSSTVMYVGAPIMDGERIIGVVSVAKPNQSLQPYIDRSRNRLLAVVAIIIVVGLVVGVLFSVWLSSSLRNLRKYALAVSRGLRVSLPIDSMSSGELRELAKSLASMRSELDGKNYIERYVQTLTHELKSPLCAIRSSAELLQSPLKDDQRLRFLGNIDTETERMQVMIEQLLSLAKIEKTQELKLCEQVNLTEIWRQLVDAKSAQMQLHAINCQFDDSSLVIGSGDPALLELMFSNLLQNALDFSVENGEITIELTTLNKRVELSVFNQGPHIPSFALERITERFYSLPRPTSGHRSSGLGLSIVTEIAQLHGANFDIANVSGGVLAKVVFPQY